MTESNPGAVLPGEWVDRAACATHNPELWHVDRRPGTQSATFDPWAQARAICQTCPVKDPCGAWSLRVREPRGMYGGMDPKERAAILAREGAELRAGRIPGKCGTEAGNAAHRRRGERPCPPCVEAATQASRRRRGRRT